MYNYIIGSLSLIWLLVYAKEDPKTIHGKLKIFFVDIAQYLKYRIIKVMENKFFLIYFLYCLSIHIIYIYYLPNIQYNNENDLEKYDIIYFILFYIMIIYATLIETEKREEYEKNLYYDNIPFYLSNLIWLFYIIIKISFKLLIMFKEQELAKLKDIKNDFYNFGVSTKYLLLNTFLLPFHISYYSYNMLNPSTSTSNSNLPISKNYLPSPISVISNLAIFSFRSLKSGISKTKTFVISYYNFFKLTDGEKLKVIINYLFTNNTNHFIFLSLTTFNYIFVVFIIIFITIVKLVRNFMTFRKKMNQKRKYQKYI